MSCEVQCKILDLLNLADLHIVSAIITLDKDFITVEATHYAEDNDGNIYLEGDEIKTIQSTFRIST